MLEKEKLAYGQPVREVKLQLKNFKTGLLGTEKAHIRLCNPSNYKDKDNNVLTESTITVELSLLVFLNISKRTRASKRRS